MQIPVESDRSHDEARYRLPDNYVTLKQITDADNRCLIFVNPNNEQHGHQSLHGGGGSL